MKAANTTAQELLQHFLTSFPLFSWVYSLIFTLALTCCIVFHTSSYAQLVGEQAEMSRLEQQADELIASGDPSGAALAIGKAAMMAGLLAKQKHDESVEEMFFGIEALFRTQEHTYRAIALFEQAGEQPPAPKGACQLLALADRQRTKAQHLFPKIDISTQFESAPPIQRYASQPQEWKQIIQELQADFTCS